MPSTIHILETALLILIAFLIGCVIGYLARRLTAGKPAAASAAESVAAAASGPQLVVAPTIAPLSRTQTPAQRIAAAAAGAKPNGSGATSVRDEMRPARVAGQATSGREIARPSAPPPAASTAAEPPEVVTPPASEVAEAVAELKAAAEAAIATEAAAEIAPAKETAVTKTATVADQVEVPAEAANSIEPAAPPKAPPVVAPEPVIETVRAEDVPQIDEAAHVAEGVTPTPVRAEEVPPIDEAAHVVAAPESADVTVEQPRAATIEHPSVAEESSPASLADVEPTEIVPDLVPPLEVEPTPLVTQPLIEDAPLAADAMQVVEGTAPAPVRQHGAESPEPEHIESQPVAAEHVAPTEIADAALVVEGRAPEPDVTPLVAETEVPEEVAPPVEDVPLVVANNADAEELAADEHVDESVSGDEPAAEPPTTPEPPPAPSAVPRDEDAEAAAMRAIEGGWTPRVTVGAQQPAPQPDLAPGEIEAAMSSARSAVASAAAAAEVAVSLAAQAAAAEPPADMDFEQAGPQAEDGALLGAHHTHTPTLDGLEFEPERPLRGFGHPETLPEPRGGLSDDLRRIKGVTPDLAHALNRIGIFHFDQIAGWDQKAIVWLDHHLSLRGRIGREKWVEQARTLTDAHAKPVRPIRR